MKQALIYFFVFGLVFANITFGIYYLNNKYENIFAFDFREKKEVKENPEKEEEKEVNLEELKEQIKTALIDSLKNEGLIRIAGEQETEKENESDEAEEKDSSKKSKKKEEYHSWTIKTAGLYESMEPDKAAKIIEKYSDDIARDILFAMNKKKAAKILANLNPEIASQITQAN